jgi:hypothetical protein
MKDIEEFFLKAREFQQQIKISSGAYNYQEVQKKRLKS